jgi:hypothetical protein
MWFGPPLGWAAVVEGFLVVAEVELAGRSHQVITAALVAAVAVALLGCSVRRGWG